MADLSNLRLLMRKLRDPEHGCPWDLAQDYASIVPHTLEEAYEVAETIETDDYDALPDELGDLLFQVVFYCQLAEEEQRFSFEDVVAAISAKLVTRHPHVFGDTPRHDAQAVASAWENAKAAERRARDQTSALDNVAQALPALSRAQKIQQRAARVGFDWPDSDGPLAKLHEELAELGAARADASAAAIEEEFGDVLFSAVNLGRHLGLNTERALRAATAKFERRFRALEDELAAAAQTPAELSLADLEARWQAVKGAQKKTGA